MRSYRVYFIDGNQKLFDAENLYSLMAYLSFEAEDISIEDIYKVEEIY